MDVYHTILDECIGVWMVVDGYKWGMEGMEGMEDKTLASLI